MLAFLKSLLLPPGLCVVIAGSALGLRFKQRLSMFLLCLAVTLLYVCSTPLGSRTLAGLLEHRYPPLAPGTQLAPDVAAIVVLGCDRYANAPEYGQDEVSACTLVRLRYAADLQTRTGLPVLLSGGHPMGEPQSEAQLMDRVMTERFGVKARWLEQDSRDTAGNAAGSAVLLRAANIQRVALVTHAMHMPRAMRSFQRQGLVPVAAPTQFYSVTDRRPAWFSLLPSSGSLLVSSMAMYEMLGLAWYSITGK